MGLISVEQGEVKIQGEKQYILLMVSASETDGVRDWFEKASASLGVEVVVTADIRGKPPLEEPIGLLALLRFDTIPQMRATITKIVSELREHDNWTFDLMRASWIDIGSGLTVRSQNESKRLVTTDGRIHFRNRRYRVGERLRGEYVELLIDSEDLRVYHDGVLVKTFKLRS